MASLEFDPKVNALYVKLGEGRISASEPLADNLIVDLDKDGQVVGIEVLLPAKIDERLGKKIREICQHR